MKCERCNEEVESGLWNQVLHNKKCNVLIIKHEFTIDNWLNADKEIRHQKLKELNTALARKDEYYLTLWKNISENKHINLEHIKN